MKNKKLIGGPTIEVWYSGVCEDDEMVGAAGSGWVVKENGKQIAQGKHYFPAARNVSNNVAAYTAAIQALEWLIDNDYACRTILVHGDNMMSVMQMAGKWKCKGGFYVPLFHKAREIIKFFLRISFKWVPRFKNREADELARVSLVENSIKLKTQKMDSEYRAVVQ